MAKPTTPSSRCSSQAWRLPKSTFEIVRGGTAREKTLMVAGDPAVLADRIAEWMRKNG
jgi:uncharacterized protein YggU (UPF0235/DUF167 family)